MEKGPLIISFRSGIPIKTWLLLGGLVFYLLLLGGRIAAGRDLRGLNAAPVLIPVAVGVFNALRQTVRLYENGIWVPAAPDKTPARFLAWSQIDRYQFEGDSLYLAGTESMLKGGPVRSATLIVPQDAQAQVMSVLAGHVGTTSG